MDKGELRGHIETIINNTFEAIDEVYKTNQESAEGKFCNSKSRLVFPKYRDGRTRVSEQELRFLFVEQFNKYCAGNGLNLYYSVETPTEKKYDFQSTPKMQCLETEDKGESAQFDLVIYNESKERVCLIEFKNNSNDAGEHEKDMLKLSKESNGKPCYFISIADAPDANTLGESDGAKKGIIPKFKRFADNDEICFENITYICHCLNNRKGKGFDTIYAGSVAEKYVGWREVSAIFEK